MKKLNFIHIVYFLFPLINLSTGLMTRYNIFSLTTGVAVRIALLLFLFLYVLFRSKSKYKKISIIYYLLLGASGLLLLISRKSFSIRLIYTECNYLFKFMYFPILFFGLLNLFDEEKYDKEKWKKIFYTSIIFYIIFIIVPILTKTSFNSYVREKVGLVGWFYAANEVGPIMLMLFPILFSIKNKNKILHFILTCFGIISIIGISTKVSKYGLGIIILAYLIIYFIFKRKDWKNKTMLVGVFAVYLLLVSPFGCNFFDKVEKYNANESNTKINDSNNMPNNETSQKPNHNPNVPSETISKPTDDKKFWNILLSNRDIKMQNMFEQYKNETLIKKIVGIGFYREATNDTFLVEMDVMDILFHYGILGVILLLFPYLYMLYLLIKSIKNNVIKLDLHLCYSILVFLLILGIGFLSGHVLGSPAVTSLLAIYGIYICSFADKSLIKEEN